MSAYNRFGAVYTDVVSLYTGSVADDFGGQTAIEAALDRATNRLVGLIPATWSTILGEGVKFEKVEDDATSGATSITLGLVPVVSGTTYVWVRPRNDDYRVPPRYEDGYHRAHTLTNAATGAVTLTDGLADGDIVYASYRVDVDNAAFSMSSLADVVRYHAAYVLGAQVYTVDAQEWQLVAEYKELANTMLEQIQSGEFVPPEIKELEFWTEVESASPQGAATMRSVGFLRG